MSWFIFALICLLGWGGADLFYKAGTDEADRYSHLKIAVWVGLVMGAGALILIPFAESLSPGTALKDALLYSPASLCYIISMVIGYAGLRYLELSVVSPVQNASGALSAVFIMIFFAFTGKISAINDVFSPLDIGGTVLIVIGVILLAVAEQKLSSSGSALSADDRKFRMGAAALIFPLLYCLFDTVGTAADGIILDEDTGLGLGEIDVIILYGATFFIFGLCCWVFLIIKERKFYNPFARGERIKGAAALCEEFGQIFYVYAMASNPVLAEPMVLSYCIFSVILSGLILKEKLKASQYVCITLVIIGIVLLGVSEGIGEL